jgi:DNA-binding CsgD family transcriptional regulator
VLAWALFAHDAAFRDADPVRALNAVGRGLVIAQDSGSRAVASVLANNLALREAGQGDPVSAFDHLTLAIRNYHNAGDTTIIRVPLAVLAVLFDRLGRYEPAATIAEFALSPLSASGVPEITTAITHLRDVLGEATYESLARKGETMTTAAMATYAYDQIDQARTELETHAQRGRGERKRPTSGWASLTPTERDVVRLVSEGLANKDIAARLFVSPRTVQTHLTHVYTKLGLISRVQLAQEANRHD